MSNSTNMIADMKSVISNGPSSVTVANSIAAAGPIMDYPGLNNLLLGKLQYANVLMAKIKTDTDGSDPNLTNINAIIAALTGLSSPSTGVITAIKAIYVAGPTAASSALAISPTGPIMDYLGNVKGVEVMFKECAELIVYVLDNTDSGTDGTNRTLLLGVQGDLT